MSKRSAASIIPVVLLFIAAGLLAGPPVAAQLAPQSDKPTD